MELFSAVYCNYIGCSLPSQNFHQSRKRNVKRNCNGSHWLDNSVDMYWCVGGILSLSCRQWYNTPPPKKKTPGNCKIKSDHTNIPHTDLQSEGLNIWRLWGAAVGKSHLLDTKTPPATALLQHHLMQYCTLHIFFFTILIVSVDFKV